MKRVRDTAPSLVDTRAQSASGQRILFTGPNGIGDFRPRLDYFPRSTGIGPLSPDATSDLNYLFRSAPSATPPLPKHCYTGGVGWGLQYSNTLNRRTLISSIHNEIDQFHSAGDDGVTHSPCTQAHSRPVIGQAADLLEAFSEPQHT
ncbi:uncharacterized protein C4orf45 [Xyrauchen texanus]|uniref:uncharacterized protein C4orf45 n=1 Tax=Xyrauchen texanus TaxID=154827 RepID=UPI002241DBCA|nr:uncharacterized protein C4orf45 [Xyrauchen texanus]